MLRATDPLTYFTRLRIYSVRSWAASVCARARARSCVLVEAMARTPTSGRCDDIARVPPSLGVEIIRAHALLELCYRVLPAHVTPKVLRVQSEVGECRGLQYFSQKHVFLNQSLWTGWVRSPLVPSPPPAETVFKGLRT